MISTLRLCENSFIKRNNFVFFKFLYKDRLPYTRIDGVKKPKRTAVDYM